MSESLLLFTASWLLCLLVTPGVRALARRWRLVDKPDGRRKLHLRETPLVGGVTLLLSVTLPLVVALLLPNGSPLMHAIQGQDLLALFLGTAAICVVGVADDYGCLRGRHKLLGQAFAASVVIACGVRINAVHLFGCNIELGLLSIPATLLVLLGAINSLNLLDGMDGLLSTVGLIVCLALGTMALINGHPTAALLAFGLAGALLGFLFYNFPPASVFLGDSGSMVIGLTIGVLSIRSFLKAPATVVLAAPAALLILPIFDTVAAILRRKLTGRSIYCTDRAHLHHSLLSRGLSVRGVLLLVACLSLLAVAGALGSVAFDNELIALVSASAVTAILVCTGLFGHVEIALLGKRLGALARRTFRGTRSGTGRETAFRLQGNLDWPQLWSLILERVHPLNLRRVRLDVNAPALNEGFHASWDRHLDEAQVTWRAEVPLFADGRTIGSIEVVGPWDGEPVWDKMARLARLLQTFDARIASLMTHRDRPKAAPSAVPVAVPMPRLIPAGQMQTN